MGRQRSRKHMREQNRDPGIMESSKLRDAEFKTLVIKMLNELLGSVENSNKEIKMEMEIIKGNQSEMENTLSEMRSILNGINKRINKVNKEEDQMPSLEDEKAKDTQSEWQEKRCWDYKNNLSGTQDTIKGPNICLIGVTEENQDVEQLLEEIMIESFPNLVKKMDIKPQEAQRIPKTNDPKRPTPRHSIIKMPKVI